MIKLPSSRALGRSTTSTSPVPIALPQASRTPRDVTEDRLQAPFVSAWDNDDEASDKETPFV